MILFFFWAVQNENDQKLLVKIAKRGSIALSILTIVALYFFSHHFPNNWGVFAYKWLRDTRIAEITALSGGIYRVFIQSQIFCLLTFLMAIFADQGSYDSLFAQQAPTKGRIFIILKNYAWVILPAAAIIISGSRSFALGLIVAVIVWIVLVNQPFSHRRESARVNRAGAIAAIKKITVVIIGGALVYGLFLFFPIPLPRSQTSFQDMLRSRQISERDAATASRWSLLTKLNEKIMKAPILGSGFGATITYQSFDPRIISSTGGTYTTSAFEWNYQDILVKMGIFGLLAYLYLLFVIFSILNNAPQKVRLWLLPAFFALLAINAVSPFLNHPLGIGYLALLIALAECKKGETERATVSALAKNPSGATLAVPGLAISPSPIIRTKTNIQINGSVD